MALFLETTYSLSLDRGSNPSSNGSSPLMENRGFCRVAYSAFSTSSTLYWTKKASWSASSSECIELGSLDSPQSETTSG